MLYLQKYLTNSQKLFFAWKMRNVAILVENLKMHRHFSFAMATFTTFPSSRTFKNFNFSQYTVPAEMLYLQKYITNFPKTFFWLKDEECGYSGWKFEMRRHFSFAIATLQLFQHPEHVKILIFPITLSQQKCYIFKSI